MREIDQESVLPIARKPLNPHLGTLETFADIDAVSETACNDLVVLAREAIAARGRFSISLAGGSTPKRLYSLMADRQDEFQWNSIHLFWGDERNVPLDHDDSNYRMVRTAMIDRVPIPSKNVHAVPIDPDKPGEAASKYTAELREYFGGDTYDWDLVLLGMGDDAHTASLFPETSALNDSASRMVENWVEKFSTYRLTLTAPAINSAHNIWFMIGGDAKQRALSNVWGSEQNTTEFPSQLIQPTSGTLRWMITTDAIPS